MNNKTQTQNEAGIKWLGGGGQLRPEKLSGNIGLLSQLPRAASGHIPVLTIKDMSASCKMAVTHGVFVWVRKLCPFKDRRLLKGFSTRELTPLSLNQSHVGSLPPTYSSSQDSLDWAFGLLLVNGDHLGLG